MSFILERDFLHHSYFGLGESTTSQFEIEKRSEIRANFGCLQLHFEVERFGSGAYRDYCYRFFVAVS